MKAKPKGGMKAIRLRRMNAAIEEIAQMRQRFPERRGKSVYADGQREAVNFIREDHPGCDAEAGYCEICKQRRKRAVMPRNRAVNVTGSGWSGMRGSADLIAEGIAHGIEQNWTDILVFAERYVRDLERKLRD